MDLWCNDSATAAATYGDISTWVTSSVKDMSRLFSLSGHCHDANFNSDISYMYWDTSRVVAMNHMFYNARAFNADLSHWDVSRVRTMQLMFHSATSFNADISKWNVAHVKDLRFMFSGASSFDRDLSEWDLSRARSVRFMFFRATSFSQALCFDKAKGSIAIHNASDVSGCRSESIVFPRTPDPSAANRETDKRIRRRRDRGGRQAVGSERKAAAVEESYYYSSAPSD